ncbi:MAG: hypothetical protein RL757_2819 [Bacteroidota bacterium]|jgi:Xaa-Pro aminopeptidase
MTINQKLIALRAAMQTAGLSAYIVPSSDPHQSEYVAEHWKSRVWISGFTGSMGYALITHDEAHVWTDGRYFLQAEMELADSDFVLKKQVQQGAPEHVDWLVEHLSAGEKVGCDGALFSIAEVEMMQKKLATKGIHLETDADLIAKVWSDRPKLPESPVFEHDVRFTGVSRGEKLNAIRAEMSKLGATHHLVSTLDDIAWILNIRAVGDVECNPVSIAYLLIEPESCQLFIDADKVDAPLRNIFSKDNISIKRYDAVKKTLRELPPPVSLLIDGESLNFELFNAVENAKKVMGTTPSRLMKARKNTVEQAYIRSAMVKDGVALVRAFRWLELELAAKKSISECDFAERIAASRASMPDYSGESFAAIIGFNGNGAIIHYHPMPETCAQIVAGDGNILLADSGGQYTDGTTDITRTIALGTPTRDQKQHFTLVLKGMIGVSMLQFPKGTRGVQMDVLARQHLWAQGLNYGHGTGHGVGFFLNVHEPPQGIVPALNQRGVTIMEEGMFTSNEPGFYLANAYGIRIENLVLTQPSVETAFGQFLKFETVTLYPIDLTLVELNLLSREERNWLNAYHATVFEKIAPQLDVIERVWLAQKCRKV